MTHQPESRGTTGEAKRSQIPGVVIRKNVAPPKQASRQFDNHKRTAPHKVTALSNNSGISLHH